MKHKRLTGIILAVTLCFGSVAITGCDSKEPKKKSPTAEAKLTSEAGLPSPTDTNICTAVLYSENGDTKNVAPENINSEKENGWMEYHEYITNIPFNQLLEKNDYEYVYSYTGGFFFKPVGKQDPSLGFPSSYFDFGFDEVGTVITKDYELPDDCECTRLFGKLEYLFPHIAEKSEDLSKVSKEFFEEAFHAECEWGYSEFDDAYTIFFTIPSPVTDQVYAFTIVTDENGYADLLECNIEIGIYNG